MAESQLNLKITVQNEASPVLEELARVASEMAKSFEEASRSIQESFGLIERAVEEAGKVTESSMSQISKSVSTAGEGVSKLGSMVFKTREELVRDVDAMRGSMENLAHVNLDQLSTGQLKQLAQSAEDAKNPIMTLKDTFEESLDKISKTAFMTSEELKKAFDEIRMDIRNEELAMLDAAQLNESSMKKIVEAALGTKIEVIKSLDEIAEKTNPVNRAFENVAKTAVMTSAELREAFDSVKGSFNNEAIASADAAQVNETSMRRIVEAATNTRIQVVKSMEEIAKAEEEAAAKSKKAAEQAESAHKSHLSMSMMDAQFAGDSIKGVGEGISGFFESAIHSAADFDQAIVNTSASLNSNLKEGVRLTGEEVEQLREKALNLGQSGYYTANEIGEAMNVMAKQGISYQTIMSGAIDTVSTVAAANQEDITATANVVSDIIHEMGDHLGQEFGPDRKAQMAGVGDAMTAAMHHARISMDDFLQTMKYVGPQAGEMGVGIKDVSAAIAVLGEHGIKGTQAGTALRRMLTNLMPSSAGAAQAMDYLGIKVTDIFDKSTGKMKDFTTVQGVLHDKLNGSDLEGWTAKFEKVGLATSDGSNQFLTAEGKMKPMNEILALLHQKFGQMTPAMEQMAVKAIFGQFALSGMTAIVNTAPEEFKEMTDAMGKSGVAAELVAEKSEGMGMKFTKLSAEFGTIMKKIGDDLAPVTNAIVSGLESIMKWWEKLPQPMKAVAEWTGIIVGVLAVLGGGLLALIATIGMVALSLGGIAIVFGTISAPVLITIGVIAGLVAAFVGLGIVWEKWGDDITAWTKNAWNSVTNAFHEGINWLVNAVKSLGTSIQQGWTDLCNGVVNLWNSFTAWIQLKAREFVDGIIQAFTWMYDHNYYFHDLVDFIVKWWGILKAETANIWNAITTALSQAWSDITTTASSIWSGLATAFTNLWNGISNTASSWWNTISTNLSKLWNGIVTDSKTIFSAIGTFFTNLWNDAYQWGSNLVNMIANGIKSAANAVEQEVKSIAGTIAKFLGFHSPTEEGPASDSDKWAPNFVNMFANGLRDGSSTVASAATSLVAPLRDALGGVDSKSQLSAITVIAKGVMSAKQLYTDAAIKNDQAAMDKAHAMADDFRVKLTQMGYDAQAFGADKDISDVMNNMEIITKKTMYNMSESQKSMVSTTNSSNSLLAMNTDTSTNQISNSWNTSGNNMVQSWTTARDKTVTVALDLGNSLKAIMTFIENVVKQTTTNTENYFKVSFASIATAAEAAMNRVIAAMRAMQAAMAASAAMSGSVGGSYSSRIPAFAEGGIVTKPTIALVGEGGEEEYIIPKSKLMNGGMIGDMQAGGTLPLPNSLPIGSGFGSRSSQLSVGKIEVNVNGVGKDGNQIGTDIAAALRQQLGFAL